MGDERDRDEYKTERSLISCLPKLLILISDVLRYVNREVINGNEDEGRGRGFTSIVI